LSTGEIHIGDTTKLIFTIEDEDEAAVDVSGATTLTIKLQDPDGNTADYTAALNGDGTDGKITYTTTNAIWDESGPWKGQGYVVIGTTEYYSDVHTFMVHGNL